MDEKQEPIADTLVAMVTIEKRAEVFRGTDGRMYAQVQEGTSHVPPSDAQREMIAETFPDIVEREPMATDPRRTVTMDWRDFEKWLRRTYCSATIRTAGDDNKTCR